jgi:hypothetical protein
VIGVARGAVVVATAIACHQHSSASDAECRNARDGALARSDAVLSRLPARAARGQVIRLVTRAGAGPFEGSQEIDPVIAAARDLAVVPAKEREEVAVAVERGELPGTELRRIHAGARDVVEHPRGFKFGEQGVDI